MTRRNREVSPSGSESISIVNKVAAAAAMTALAFGVAGCGENAGAESDTLVRSANESGTCSSTDPNCSYEDKTTQKTKESESTTESKRLTSKPAEEEPQVIQLEHPAEGYEVKSIVDLDSLTGETFDSKTPIEKEEACRAVLRENGAGELERNEMGLRLAGDRYVEDPFAFSEIIIERWNQSWSVAMDIANGYKTDPRYAEAASNIIKHCLVHDATDALGEEADNIALDGANFIGELEDSLYSVDLLDTNVKEVSSDLFLSNTGSEILYVVTDMHETYPDGPVEGDTSGKTSEVGVLFHIRPTGTPGLWVVKMAAGDTKGEYRKIINNMMLFPGTVSR